MQIKPIITAMRHHKAGMVLIALQIALTLAIVCNALFIIDQRIQRVSRASGVDESNLFVIRNDWADKSSPQRLDAQIKADLITLGQLGSVQSTYATNSYPLRGGGWDNYARLSADQIKPTSDTAIFVADQNTLQTLGVKLIAGRNFTPDEITSRIPQEMGSWPSVIISDALAQTLFPGQQAVGKTAYVGSDGKPSTIIGVTGTLQSHMMDLDASPYAYNSTLVPGRLLDMITYYVVRSRPGELSAAMRDAPKVLFAENRMRVIDPKLGLMTFAQVRKHAYERDYGMAILMGIVCVVLLAITGAGIVGLTSFWVGQRQRQIGIRRALGATRGDILGYFLTENILIGIVGVVLGLVMAVAINLWMVTRFEMAHLSLAYLGAAALALLALGQGAVLAPALRASRVPPVVATRPA